MVISVFPNYGQAIDRYRSVRNERLERQAQETQRAAYNRLLGQVSEDQRSMYEVLQPEQGVSLMLQNQQAQAERAGQARDDYYESYNELLPRYAVRYQGAQSDEQRQAILENAQEQFGILGRRMGYQGVNPDVLERELSSYATAPQERFEPVMVDGVRMQRGPDGRYYDMPGGASPMNNLAASIAALATSQADGGGQGFILNEAPRDLAEERFGEGARAQYVQDSRGNWELVEVGERPIDREREGEQFTTEIELRRERIADLRQRRETAMDEEVRARVDQDLQEEIHDLEVAQRRQRISDMEAEAERAADAEVRARIDQDMAEERHDLEMLQLERRIEIADSQEERERLQAEQDRLEAQRERQIEQRRTRARRMSEMSQFRPIARNLEGALDTIFAHPNSIGQVAFGSQISATMAPSSPAGLIDAFLRPVRAEAAFGRLQTMRENSPTGGALGAVSNVELEFLEAAEGVMNIGTDASIVAANAIDFYDRSFYAAHGRPDEVAAAVERGDISMDVYQSYLEAEQLHRQRMNGYRGQYEGTFGAPMRQVGIPSPSESGRAGGSPVIYADENGNQIQGPQ